MLVHGMSAAAGPASVPAQQRGAALLVALMILVVISIIGIAAMRTSLFNAKISTGAQASVLAFQGAESALNAVFREATEVDQAAAGHVIGYAVAQQGLGNTVIIDRCVTTTNIHKQTPCGAADSIDGRGLVQASSRTVVKGAGRPKVGEQIGGEGTKLQYFDFVTVGEGRMQTMNISNFNVQEFTTVAIAVSPEF